MLSSKEKEKHKRNQMPYHLYFPYKSADLERLNTRLLYFMNGLIKPIRFLEKVNKGEDRNKYENVCYCMKSEIFFFCHIRKAFFIFITTSRLPLSQGFYFTARFQYHYYFFLFITYLG